MLAFKKHAALLTVGLGMSLLPLGQVQALNQETDCSKEVILAFFPEQFVKNTLEKFKVPKDQWSAISKELAAKDKDIIKVVEDKASKMDPNPLKDPSKQADAVKIFRETLFDSFSGVLKAHGVQDNKQIQDMLDDIQVQKAKRFSECFPQQAQQKANPSTPNNSDSDK